MKQITVFDMELFIQVVSHDREMISVEQNQFPQMPFMIQN